MTEDEIALIKRRGAVVIRNVVDQKLASEWEEELRQYVKENGIGGLPKVDPSIRCDIAGHSHFLIHRKSQMFSKPGTFSSLCGIFHSSSYFNSWGKPQVLARSHPSVLETQRFFNSLWHTSSDSAPISLSTQLTYADRFRIRRAGDEAWGIRHAHIDSPSMERWRDRNYRKTFDKIMKGSWREYDAFHCTGQLELGTEPV